MAQITYKWLFAYLEGLGFEDSSRSDVERVFEHSGLGVLLAFSMLDDAAVDRPVRDADVISVEFRLQQQGLLSGALTDATQRLSEH